jgi:dGTPase
VAQIARTIARQLRLDEDLAEALALAHDLGHPPFGHAGERALDFAMRNFGGFDHNAQSLRVVMHLERKYLAFDGLNLAWETLEGLAKHNGPLAPDKDDAAVLKVIKPLEAWRSLEPASFASAEAQVAALADDIAYLTHDIDDGLRAGLLANDGLDAAPLAGRVAQEARASAAKRDEGRLTYEVTRRMITEMVRSVVAESRSRLRALLPESPDDIRHAAAAVVSFSQEMSTDIAGLRAFLTARVYRSRRVMEVMDKAAEIVRDLFARYVADPAAMPEAWQAAAAGLSDRRRARLIGDFVAGMTDRYAIAEHRRLFDATPELR